MAKPEGWQPTVDNYEAADLRAIQALAAYAQLAVVAWDPDTMGPPPNTPTPFDVKQALDWIIWKAAETYDEPFVPGQPDVTNYRLGRRSVGLAIVKLMRLKQSIFDKGKGKDRE